MVDPTRHRIGAQMGTDDMLLLRSFHYVGTLDGATLINLVLGCSTEKF